MDVENIIYCVLLALHNLALVLCVAGPFYMGRIVAARGRLGKGLKYPADSLMEDVITSQPMLCWLALIVLFATGFGFPAVHLLFQGHIKEMSTVAWVAFGVKHALVLGIVGILFYGTFIINPKLKEMFAKFKEGEPADPQGEKDFFALRGVRKKWCDRCLVLGVLVLLVSPVLRFSEPTEEIGTADKGLAAGGPNNMNVAAMKAFFGKVKADPEAAKKTKKVEAEWVFTAGAPQFRATLAFKHGERLVECDMPPPMGGWGLAPGPVKYCLYGLAACYAGTFTSIATMQGVELRELRVAVENKMDLSRALGLSQNPIIEGVKMALTVSSDAPLKKLQEIKALATERCPGVYCLTEPIPLSVSLEARE